jgi:hypothetical protein
MNVGELRKALNGFADDYEILVSSDEELNTLYGGWEIAILSSKKRIITIYGLDGTEVEL